MTPSALVRQIFREYGVNQAVWQKNEDTHTRMEIQFHEWELYEDLEDLVRDRLLAEGIECTIKTYPKKNNPSEIAFVVHIPVKYFNRGTSTT